ncbi:MAG: family 16 glycosylhydrolase [Ignavibacteria bacterium]|nr:family 16 glycosylhydrolase [Ignavibacteria bacterium]
MNKINSIQLKLFFYFSVLFFLIILSDLFSKDFKGAEFRTKQTFLYGRFEVRMKSAYRSGMLSSFFTYHEFTGGIQNWNEIDIEILGRYPNDIQFNTITSGQTNHVSHYPLPFSPHEDFHVYAFEWTPTYVAWFVDGVEVYRQTGEHIPTLNKPQKLMMNIWNPEAPNWAGEFLPDALPAFAYYDWVKYYIYTPGSGNYGTGNNFTFSWSDDFNYWNTSRWDKATHTWVGNGCDFIPENAVLRDGYLILCLTNATNIGYTDTKGPVLLSAKVHNGKILVNFSEELDEVSAQTKSNYIIYGVTVDTAKLLSDKKTVELTVSGWDFISPKTLVVMNVKDDWVPANTMSPKAVNIISQTQFNFPLKINCGGPAALGYLPEQSWTLTSDYGSIDGGNSTFSFSINNTDEDEIYQSEKWGMTTYRVRIPKGVYKVKLMFAENYHNQAGQRIFDVWIENERVLQNFDVYALVGKSTAYVKEVNNVQVNDGYLDIYFVTHKDNPMINGIVIDLISLDVNDKLNLEEKKFTLHQNFPNPFNGQTKITYSIHKPDFYFFRLYDTLGQEILNKDLGYLNQGNYSFNLNLSEGLNLSSGIYLYTLNNRNSFQTKKMVLLD